VKGILISEGTDVNRVPELVGDTAAVVGEGPLWSSDHTLWWVDILGHKLNRFDPKTGANTTEFEHEHQNVAFVLEDASGDFLVGLNRTIHRFSGGSLSPEPMFEVIKPTVEMSLNDATVDPEGNLWVGVYEKDRAHREGSLWRISPAGEVSQAAGGLTLPNGIAFSPDATEMYLADSFEYSILAFDIDLTSGQLSEPRPIWRDESKGLPDGLCVDIDGSIWVAFWGGSSIRALRPDGSQVEQVDFPVTQVSSCAFAPDGWLYATSARAFLEEKDLAAQPLAGGLFRVHVGVDGSPITRFGAS
jgi:sugar lactone lactonase YvrE